MYYNYVCNDEFMHLISVPNLNCKLYEDIDYDYFFSHVPSTMPGT